MADVIICGKLVVIDDCLIENGHHLSLLKEDLVEFCEDRTLHMCSSGADELILCLWKASALRSVPVQGGCFVTANILQNLPTVITSETETLHSPVTSTIHLLADTKFLTVFCCAHFCSVFGLCDQEHVVFRLCANVPDIDRVVLCAETDDSFSWACSKSFRSELRDIMSKQTLLCMVGCSFGIHLRHFSSDEQAELWEQLCVINCIPVSQGRLTEASEIVIKCYSQQRDMLHRHNHSYKNCYQLMNSRHCDDHDTKAVMVSDFATDIANNGSFLASSELVICSSNLQEIVPTHELNFTVLTDINRMKSLITFQQSRYISDEFSVAVFSTQCAARLGVMSGNMLELSCKSSGHQRCDSRILATGLSEACQHACRQKVVIACIDTTHGAEDDVAYISSCAWFNLCSMSCMSLTRNCDTQPCYMKVRVCMCMIIY